MTTNIKETLPWVDYGEIFRKLEERGIAKGKAEGIAKGKAEGIAEGKAEGIAEGKAEGIAEIIGSMLANKVEIRDIAKMTGLSESEIKKFQ